MATAAKLLAKLELDISNFNSGISRIGSSLSGFGSSISSIGSTLTRGVTVPLMAFGAAGVFAIGDVIKSGAELERGMSGVQAILQATTKETQRLKDTAIDIGMSPNFVVTTSEVVSIMEELGKSGLSTEQILNGATEQTIAMANATGTDFALAANTGAAAISLFGLKTEEYSDVTKTATAVANQSRFDIEDFNYALGTGGASAANIGKLSIEEYGAAMIALANYTNSGRDAGTSFKTFLTNLAPTTKKQIEMFKQLGLITEDGSNKFYDASGNIRGLNEISQILKDTFGELNDEQLNMMLGETFGSDSTRAVLGLMNQGADGINEIMKNIAATDPSKSAAVRMKNLAGAAEILGGIFEGLSLKLYDSIGPPVKTLVDNFAALLENKAPMLDGLFEKLGKTFEVVGGKIAEFATEHADEFIAFLSRAMDALPGFLDKIGEVVSQFLPIVSSLFNLFMATDPSTIANIVSAIVGLGALAPVITIIGSIVSFLGQLIALGSYIVPVFSAIGTAIAAIGAPVIVLIALIGVLAYMIYSNFDALKTTLYQLGGIIDAVIRGIKQKIDDFIASAVANLRQSFDNVRAKIDEVGARIRGVFDRIKDAIGNVIGRVGELIKSFLGIKLPAVLTPGSPTPFEIGLRGIADAMSVVNDTGLAGVVSPSSVGVKAPDLALQNSGATSSGAVYNVTVNNPVGETSENSVKKMLKNLNYLGVPA